MTTSEADRRSAHRRVGTAAVLAFLALLLLGATHRSAQADPAAVPAATPDPGTQAPGYPPGLGGRGPRDDDGDGGWGRHDGDGGGGFDGGPPGGGAVPVPPGGGVGGGAPDSGGAAPDTGGGTTPAPSTGGSQT